MAQRRSAKRASNGRGSITRPTATVPFWRWTGRWIRPDGTQGRKQIAAKSESALIAAVDAFQRDRGTATPMVVGDKITVGQWAEHWLANKAMELRGNSLHSYRRTLDLHVLPKVGHIELRALTAADIDGGVIRPLHAAGHERTAVYARTLLLTMLRSAMVAGLIERNVVEATVRPSVPKVERVVFTAAQLGQLVDGLPETSTGALIGFLALTGRRVGEASALDWSDVDLETGRALIRRTVTKGADGRRTIGEPKSKASRTDLHLSPRLVELLTAQRQRTGGDGYVFPSELGGPAYTRTVAKVLDATTTRLGLPRMPVHGLRHGYVSLQYASGADLITLARQVGHADPSLILKVYGHAFDARVRDVAHGIDALLDGPV